ncbi:hypothetical protein CHS0354_004059 [Potamilus streckersoni]|uniref:Uncharacterized protein n=1 Tax=Potamilus streckersoni TaxID=2493646 RepID=A0AAE0W9K9_9BIVA|nr:hypothetical protein CHS0354_004059 [Potamilus streckersoni]
MLCWQLKRHEHVSRKVAAWTDGDSTRRGHLIISNLLVVSAILLKVKRNLQLNTSVHRSDIPAHSEDASHRNQLADLSCSESVERRACARADEIEILARVDPAAFASILTKNTHLLLLFCTQEF